MFLFRNNKCNMQNVNFKDSKFFCIRFVILFVIGLFGLFFYNYMVDPYNYFSDEHHGSWEYSQYYKINYISKNPEKYNCFIIGGSNAGALNPDLIDSYTGYNTYSMTFASGSWQYYYEYINYLVEETDVECIYLHLSSTELGRNLDNVGDFHSLPAKIFGGWKEVKECFSFLTKSIKTDQRQSLVRLNKNGSFDWENQYTEFKSDPQNYVERWVLYDYETKLEQLGNKYFDYEDIDICIDYATRIVNLCEQNDVKLIILNGPVFLAKRSVFECSAYYDYLERLVGITDIYDFSSWNSINANPYNFYDFNHYNNELGTAIIKYVHDGSNLVDDFGVLLTKDNIDSYLAKRKCDFEKTKEEFDKTGTVSFENYADSSNMNLN